MRAADVPARLATIVCPTMDEPHAVSGPALSARRIAIISTAGLAPAGDRLFSLGGADYRIIDTEDQRPIQMTHISTNFDRSGFAADLNVVFPLQRLHEQAERGQIGSVARYHYSFMGASDPQTMRPALDQIVGLLKADNVDIALLVPV